MAQIVRAEVIRAGVWEIKDNPVQARLALLAYGHMCESADDRTICDAAIRFWMSELYDPMPLAVLYRVYVRRHPDEVVDLGNTVSVERLLNRIKEGE